jgi:AcrR family transcriptional regulator
VSTESSPTKERIVEEAMRLFAERGYKGASITQIEQAAGLSSGAGGLYRHFSSKDEILATGVSRHLERLDALRAVRENFADFGDIATQLGAIGRFFLAELDTETELLLILVSERLHRPSLLNEAMDRLISSTYDSFADWLRQVSARSLDRDEAQTIATTALGSLLSSRLLKHAVGEKAAASDDERLIRTWVEMVKAVI